MTAVPGPRAPRRLEIGATTPAAVVAALAVSQVAGRPSPAAELVELSRAVLGDPRDGIGQVLRALRAPNSDPGRRVDLLVLLTQAQQHAGLNSEALVSGRTAVKAAQQVEDRPRLTASLAAQADAEACFGSADAVQWCTLFFEAVVRSAEQAAGFEQVELMRAVVAGALRAVAIYHRQGCVQARELLAILVTRTAPDSRERSTLMAAGAAMDSGCSFTCQPLPTNPLPPMPGLFLAPGPATTDIDWIARRVLLFPPMHTCEFAGQHSAPGTATDGKE